MDTVGFSKCLMYFEVFVSERIDPSRNNAHLILIKPQILHTIGIPKYSLCFSNQHLQRHALIFCNLNTQLLKLFKNSVPVIVGFSH